MGIVLTASVNYRVSGGIRVRVFMIRISDITQWYHLLVSLIALPFETCAISASMMPCAAVGDGTLCARYVVIVWCRLCWYLVLVSCAGILF